MRRLRERRAQGIVMCAQVKVGEGGIDLLISNGLLKATARAKRAAIEKAVAAALEQWAGGRGARTTVHSN